MELENRDWKAFSLTNIFSAIQRGKRLKKDDHIEGNIPYASSRAFNNGIDGFIGNKNGVRTFENCLTIANSGSVGSTFYQPYNVVASDHVTKLENQNFNKYIYLFLATMTSRVSGKYGFNREINDQRIKKEKILLPITSNGKPDYDFMESYMKQKETELLEAYKNHLSALKPSTKVKSAVEWKEFLIGDIFKIYSTSSSIDKVKLTGKSGLYPYITRTDKNNGYDTFVGKQSKYSTDKGNVITIGLDTQTVFYQKTEFYTGQNIQILEFDEISEHNAQFIIALLKIQMKKFNWGGNGATLTRLKKTKILLPKTTDGKPDFVYMENYMKALEYDKLKQYLNYKKLNTND